MFARCSAPVYLFSLGAVLLSVASPASGQWNAVRGSSMVPMAGPDPYGGTDPFWGHPYYYRGRGFARYDAWNYRPATAYYAPASQAEPEVPRTAALVEVDIPAQAELFFSGEKTQQTGPWRQFVTPELGEGKRYYYTLTARWKQDGAIVENSRRIRVAPGERVSVDLRPSR